MKRILLNTKISKIYILGTILISLLLLGSYFSYAMFTVTKEKSNAISIITGTLSYELLVDGVSTENLVVNANSSKEFVITLSNPNSRIARFNFYYVGVLPDGVSAGYVVEEGVNTPPEATGVNLETSGSVGASNIYKIKVSNNSGSNVIITLGVEVGLDYNDLTLPSDGYLFAEVEYPTVAEVLLAGVGENGAINTTDPEQTFITGTDPNNYIWYSGKLWRAVSINPTDNSVKLVTQWNISAISYGINSNFNDSYMKEWLNDTSVDGFLGNLREPEKFIKMDSVWNATEMTDTTKPPKTTMVTEAVGLLNVYEYTMSYSDTDCSNGYLNNGLNWWCATPYSLSYIWFVSYDGYIYTDSVAEWTHGIRPSINLKPNVKIVDGNGTLDNPYRIEGDNDTNLSGTLLNTRYSGEYIRFGAGENNLYRIVSHENGNGTKIVSAEPLKNDGTFVTTPFGDNVTFSSANTIGTFLNNDYLNIGNGYLTVDDITMIEDNTTWYLGVVGANASYKLAKYTNAIDDIITSSTISAKVGLLRLGELMAGQFERYMVKGEASSTGFTTDYWILTPYSSSDSRCIVSYGDAFTTPFSSISHGIQPSVNLKSNVIITSGDGTLQNPFMIILDS